MLYAYALVNISCLCNAHRLKKSIFFTHMTFMNNSYRNITYRSVASLKQMIKTPAGVKTLTFSLLACSHTRLKVQQAPLCEVCGNELCLTDISRRPIKTA